MDYIYQEKIKCNVKLLNKELWNQFCNLETEMIITKPGRRMFPAMRVQVEDLDPNKDYCFLVEMVPASKCRYRYSASGGWAPAGSEEAQSPNRIFVHPESPAPGYHWMTQAVSFGRLKLTNTTNAPRGHVVMSSMHKYQPRIIIVEASDVRMIHDYCPSATITFPETQFIAVTAYQNDKMTKLKIDHNPFAKGFRETGQSKCKRKRQRLEKEKLEREQTDCENDQEIVVVDDTKSPSKRLAPLSPNTAASTLDLSLSISSDSGMSDCERLSSASSTSPIPSLNTSHSPQPKSATRMFPYNPYISMPYAPPGPGYAHGLCDMYNPYYFSGYTQYYPYLSALANVLPASSTAALSYGQVAEDLSVGKVKKEEKDIEAPEIKSKSKQPIEREREPVRTKFTDFSIRAITGFA